MHIDIELAEGEVIRGVVVQTADGRQELREVAADEVAVGAIDVAGGPAAEPPPAEIRFFVIPSVVVVADDQGQDVSVDLRKGERADTLRLSECVVPTSWPRGIEVAARVHVAQGLLVLDEPRCFLCGGTGQSPFNPPGWEGGTCPSCDGTGDYVVKAAATGDDREVVL
jgi:hypothetical protein